MTSDSLIQSGTVLLESHSNQRKQKSWLFTTPVKTLETYKISEIIPVLEEIDRLTAKGFFAAGFITYEAAPAFDEAATVKTGGNLPLCWFGIYRSRTAVKPSEINKDEAFQLGEWRSSVSYDEYCKAIKRIKDYIKAGDTYQVNYTFRQASTIKGSPFACYQRMFEAQQSAYSAYIDTGNHQVLSASPELFFKLAGNSLESKPMKGTAPRGRFKAEDLEIIQSLAESAKNRAENIMIADMIRNDMSKIAEKNSVRASDLFHIDTYPTLHQMISTVRCRTSESVTGIFKALFPCASITGAPKIRTMQIIAELESTPRNAYCGAIGYIGPGQDAEFNVAIRTLTVDANTGAVVYGTGGGITWDSTEHDEYDECQTKTKILFATPPEFELLETMLYDSQSGCFLQNRHFDRISASAAYFQYPFNSGKALRQLEAVTKNLPSGKHKIRMLLARDGRITVQATPLDNLPGAPRIGLSRLSVDSSNRFLYNKTTLRHLYEKAKTSRPDCDDAVLYNERGEITETTIANIAVQIKGILYTPPVHCGLLPGVMREELISQGKIHERILFPNDMKNAEKILLINSLRGIRNAIWID